MSSAATLERPRSPWIISPAWDMLYIVATPLAIVPIVMWLQKDVFTPAQIILAVTAFATLGHHLPGFMRAYGDRELFARFKWRFLLVPPLAVTTALIFSPPPALASRLGIGWSQLHGLELMLLLWGTWHGLMQTYGFMRIYDLKQSGPDRWSARLDFWLCLMLFAAGVVFSDSRIYGVMQTVWQTGVPIVDRAWLENTRLIVGTGAVVVIIAYVANLARLGWMGRKISGIKLLLALTTGGLYWFSGLVTTNLVIGIAMFEIFHAVQYYAIVWIYNRRLAERVGERFGPLGFLFRDRWPRLALYLAAIAAFGGLRYWAGPPDDYASIGARPDFFIALVALFNASTLLHYYFDGFIWKVREASTQQNLDLESPSGWNRDTVVPAAAHAAKWGVFYAIAAGLFYLQTREPTSGKDDGEVLAALVDWTPDVPELQVQLSQRQLDQGDVASAIETAERALRLRPRTAEAHAALGQALMAADRWQEGLTQLTEAFHLKPWAEEYQETVARALAADPKPGAAEKSLRHVLGYAAKSSIIRAALVEALARSGKADEALALARSLVKDDPGSAAGHAALGTALLEAGQRGEAAEAYQRAVELQPQSATLHMQLGLARLAESNYSTAEKSLRRAVELDPANEKAQFHLAHLLLSTGRYYDAIEAYRRVLDLAPDNVAAQCDLGAAWQSVGRNDQAEAAYRRALELDDQFADAHHNLALVLLFDGRTIQARRHAREAERLGKPFLPQERAALGL